MFKTVGGTKGGASVMALFIVFQILPGGSVLADPDAPGAAGSGGAVGRHALMFSVGSMDHGRTRVSVGALNVFNNTGPAAWIGYAYRLDAAWAVQAVIGWVGSTDVTVEVPSVATETASIVPILFGARFQPPALAFGRARPFLSALVGPYVGTFTTAGVFPLSAGAGTESAFGARVGGGVDVLIGKRFTLGGAVRYNAVTDFDDGRLGERDSYGGIEGALVFGVSWGESVGGAAD